MYVPLSICVVTRNNDAELKLTLSSIARQSIQPYEVIIKDAISRPEPNYVKDFDLNSIYDSNSDLGIYDGMNKALQHASSPYLLFLNSGDQLSSEHSLKFVNDMITDWNSSKPVMFLLSWAHLATDRVFKPSKSPLIFNHQAVVYSSNMHAQVGMYVSSRGLYSADYLFFYAASRCYDCLISNQVFSTIDPNGISASLRTPLNVACIKYLHGDASRLDLILISLLHPLSYFVKMIIRSISS
jgi:putative colanic acid biosynthesis glycosyltransferase